MPSPETELMREDEKEQARLEVLKDERLRYKVCKNCGKIIRRYKLMQGSPYYHLHNDSEFCNKNKAIPMED